jgi:hypothetical protein
MRAAYARYAWEVQSRHVLALLLVAGACNPPRGDGRAESCAEGEARMLELSAEMTAQFAAPCTADDECVIVRASGTCPAAGPFSLPDEAILFSQVSAASEFVDDHAASLCPAEECTFPTFDNFYIAATCDQGTCRGTAADPALICGDLVTRVNSAASAAADALSSTCTTDADCITTTPVWRCDQFGHVVTGCPVVVNPGQSIAVDDELATPCVDHPFDCIIEANCNVVTPTCAEGQCQAL